jgi:hypothetical protein
VHEGSGQDHGGKDYHHKDHRDVTSFVTRHPPFTIRHLSSIIRRSEAV